MLLKISDKDCLSSPIPFAFLHPRFALSFLFFYFLSLRLIMIRTTEKKALSRLSGIVGNRWHQTVSSLPRRAKGKFFPPTLLVWEGILSLSVALTLSTFLVIEFYRL